jgi:hypothetical protein
MSPLSPIRERPSASRIDDLGSAHTGAFPKTGYFGGPPTPSRRRPGLASATRASALLRTVAPMR